MCTAINFKTIDNYFGRTLDLEYSYNEQVIITPRNYCMKFKYAQQIRNSFAIIGIGIIQNNYPLYYDAINEKGLSIAGLNFPNSYKYIKKANDKINLASYEVIPWILRNFSSIAELRSMIDKINITPDSFNEAYSTSPLHWLVSDNAQTITIEQTNYGLQVFDNTVGVLTNEPPFEMQIESLTKYIGLTPYEPVNTFGKDACISVNSRGLGAVGLPGDFSSNSRFIRAAFNKLNSVCDKDENSSVNQFFNILDTVKQINGCVRLPENKLEKTVYTTCYNTNKGTVYYKTYNNSAITKVELFNEKIKEKNLIYYDMLNKPCFISQNTKAKGN